MGKAICLINQKGGVGKTATSVHLGAFLSEKGYKTLLIDFDPQCDSTKSLKAFNENYNAFDFINESDKKIDFYKHSINDNYFILTGDRRIKDVKLDRKRIKNKVDILKKYFDYILIDCNPHLLEENRITLNEAILVASDFAILPTDPDPNSMQNTTYFLPDVLKIKKLHNHDLKVLGIVFTKVDANRKIFKKYFDEFKSQNQEFIFKSFIRNDEKIRHSQLIGETIYEYDRNSNAFKDFNEFGDEVLQKIKIYE